MSEEQSNDLPPGWEPTSIGEVCRVNPRMAWPEGFGEDTPISFVPMAAVDDVTGTIVAAEDAPIGERWRGYKRFAEGDVIFARITPCMENGKSAIARRLTNGIGLGSTEFIVIRPSQSVISEWVYHYVRRQLYRDEASRSMTGTAGQLRVSKDYIADSWLPLPPLPEQRRIVAKIEALFEQSRTAREALDAIPPLIQQFRQAVLAAAFRGELTERDPDDEPAWALLERIREERRRRWEEDLVAQGKDPSRRRYKEPELPDDWRLHDIPDTWEWVTVEMLAAEEPHSLTDGPFGSNLKTADYVDSGIRVIRLQNVGVTEFKDDDAAFVTEEKYLSLIRHEALAGDVIIAALADPVGRACIVPNHIGSAIVKADCVRLRVDPQLALYRYVMYALNSPEHFRQATDLAHGVGRLRVNLSNIRSFVVPIAPMREQHEIVMRIDALYDLADSIDAAVNVSRHRVGTIDQAILARAFRGELVPQDPTDEPASALLARIREERGE